MVKLFQIKCIIKIPKLLFFVLVFSVFSCENKEEKKNATSTLEVKTETPFEFGVWITANKEKSEKDYNVEFKKYKNAGIDEVLINTETNPVLLKISTNSHKKRLKSTCVDHGYETSWRFYCINTS